MKKIISLLLAITAIATLLTGCGSSSPKEVTMTQAIEISRLKFNAKDVSCMLCDGEEDVCALNMYQSEVGVGDYETITICKECCEKDCPYCGDTEAKYLCFSMLGYPLLICEDDLKDIQNGF
ncbi:MAG: hypothetical protein ACI4IG_03415 [Eubacterium sp.]